MRLTGRIVGKEMVFNEITKLRFIENNQGKQIVVGVPKPLRSNQQNRFYWLYLHIISEETGNDTEDLHTFFRGRFLRARRKILGQDEWIPMSTTQLSKAEYSEYLDKICALTNVPIPTREQAEALGYILNT